MTPRGPSRAHSPQRSLPFPRGLTFLWRSCPRRTWAYQLLFLIQVILGCFFFWSAEEPTSLEMQRDFWDQCFCCCYCFVLKRKILCYQDVEGILKKKQQKPRTFASQLPDSISHWLLLSAFSSFIKKYRVESFSVLYQRGKETQCQQVKGCELETEG